jgi:hypothetical protein
MGKGLKKYFGNLESMMPDLEGIYYKYAEVG